MIPDPDAAPQPASAPHRSVDDIVAGMAPVSLADLNADAELQTRTDRKYILSGEQSEAFLEAIGANCAVLDIDGRRRFGYSTMYHDTEDRRLYRDTARRRPRRFKVRIRQYTDSNLVMLEVKTKNGRGRTVKHRLDTAELRTPHSWPGAALTSEMRSFVDQAVVNGLSHELRPSLGVEFDRTTLLTAGGDVRCTIDVGLRGDDLRGGVVTPDIVVVETKSQQRASAVDRWLWASGIRPARMSKYCTCAAALDATLAANHWHRTLQLHFPPRRSVQPVLDRVAHEIAAPTEVEFAEDVADVVLRGLG